jgi:hypothetical protein
MILTFCLGLVIGVALSLAVLRFSRRACRCCGIERAVLDAWYDEEYGCTRCNVERPPPSQEEIDAIIHDGFPDLLAASRDVAHEWRLAWAKAEEAAFPAITGE